MNDFVKVTFTVAPYNEIATDILAALLADEGYDTFVPEENGMSAYVQRKLYDASLLPQVIQDFPLEGYTFEYNVEEIEGEDWNSEWEKNYFQPIIVDERCVIHSTFHKDIPQLEYDILIDPKMAFGTGHHQTTCHMVRAILAGEMQGKKVLDMGCGTALLAILARKCGASSAVAIDIDEFAYENAIENIRLNGVSDIDVRLGGVEALRAEDSFDCVIANINRNILLQDMSSYVNYMHIGSEMFISGFYVEDMLILKDEAARLGLRYVDYAEDNRWAMMRFVKE